MGNRAVITTEDKDLGLYLHWNGDRVPVDGFLAYAKAMNYRPPEDDEYGWARLSQTVMNCKDLMVLCQIVSNWFGPKGLSVGLGEYKHLDTDNGDNGVYVISDWKIVKRMYRQEREYLTSEEDLIEMMKEIRDEQPKHSQLTDEQIKVAADKYLSMYASKSK